MTGFVGRLCHRHRWLVLLFWLGVMVGGAMAAGPVFDRMGEPTTLSGAETGDAHEVLRAARSDGDTAVVMDVSDKILAGLPVALGVIAAAMLLLLFLMTGSLVVPVKALLMSVVSPWARRSAC